MCGKDLIDSVTLSSKICRALGGVPPESFIYELFLDEEGGKISKSKGNGLTIEEWLTYASPESLSLFMFQKPKAAKRLYFDVIPRTVDEYLQFLAGLSAPGRQGPARQRGLAHPRRRAAGGRAADLVRRCCSTSWPRRTPHDKDVLWGFIRRHAPDASPETHPLLDHLAGYAVRYYEDFVKPQKKFRLPDEVGGRRAAARCRMRSARCRPAPAAEELQGILYDVGRAIPRYQDPNAKGATPDKPGVSNAWFGAIYQVLLGEEKGPRFGSFIELYGVENTRALIDQGAEGRAGESKPNSVGACGRPSP